MCQLLYLFHYLINYLIREGNDINDSGKITYEELLKQVCKFANALKSLGVKKGDRVGIYLPMVVEVAVAMLACARIGAMHSVVVITMYLWFLHYLPGPGHILYLS